MQDKTQMDRVSQSHNDVKQASFQSKSGPQWAKETHLCLQLLISGP